MIRSTVAMARRRMEGPEHEMPGLRGLDRDRDGLEVAQLAHEDDIGVFAERCAKRRFERSRVIADLPLIDETFLIPVHELDRVLDGDDVVRPILVDVIDHRCQGCGLARAGRTRDEHEAFREKTQLQDRWRKTQLLGGQDFDGNGSNDRSDTFAVFEHVHPEA